MATVKVTVTVEEAQLEAIRKLVRSGEAQSVSGFVKHAVSISLSDVAAWGSVLKRALEETGGDLTAEDRRWADSILQTRPKKRTRKTAA